jgi:hypothetical protein
LPDKNRAFAGGLDGDSNREKKRQQKHQGNRRADQVEGPLGSDVREPGALF